MEKKIRSLILLVCAVAFLIIIPFLLLYSLGYRVDFSKRKITATGGIYVKAQPDSVNVQIDQDNSTTTSLFFTSVFVQNLLPGIHQVRITKDGYFDYQKSLAVRNNEVTKLEHVLLFKKNPSFSIVADGVDFFSLSPDGSHLLADRTLVAGRNLELFTLPANQSRPLKNMSLFSLAGASAWRAAWTADDNFALISAGSGYALADLTRLQLTSPAFLRNARSPQFDTRDDTNIFYLENDNLFSSKSTLPIAKKVLAYASTSQGPVWLAADGTLYQLPPSSAKPEKINNAPFIPAGGATLQLSSYAGTLVLIQNDTLFWFNPAAGTFENLYRPVTSLALSPDNQKLLACNSREILYVPITPAIPAPVFLNRFAGPVGNCEWLNNDYILFTLNGLVTISEIDARGNVNFVTLPNPLPVNGTPLALTPAQEILSLNPQDKKLYLLNQNTLLASERVSP